MASSAASAASAASRQVVLVDEAPRGTALEPLAEVGRLAARGEDDDRSVGVLREPLGDREPVGVRQHDVEQDELGAQLLDGGERGRSVIGLADDRKAAGLEQPAGETAEAGVVVDDQHRLRHVRDRLTQVAARASGKSPIFAAGPGISSMRRGEQRAYRRRHERPSAPAHRCRRSRRRGAAQLVATGARARLERRPRRGDPCRRGSEFWTGGRLLDLIGVFLTVGALTVVGRTFAEGAGGNGRGPASPSSCSWARSGRAAVVTGATMEDMADAWVAAGPQAKQSYLAAFDATTGVTEDLFFGAFLAMGLYLADARDRDPDRARLSRAGSAGPRRRARASYSSGDLLVLVSDSAFIAVLAGFVLFMRYRSPSASRCGARRRSLGTGSPRKRPSA